MDKISRLWLLFAFCIGGPLTAYGAAFSPIGTDSIAMGGTGVASAGMRYAPYYNPALLAEAKKAVDFGFDIGVGLRDVDLGEHVDNLSDIDIDADMSVLENPTGSSVQEILTALNDTSLFINELGQIPTVNGLQLMPGINLGFQVENTGFGIYTISDASATAVVDREHLDIIIKEDTGSGPVYLKYEPTSHTPSLTTAAEYEASSLQYALDNGLTYLHITGLAYLEIPLSGAYGFATALGRLDIGGSLKIMPGYTVDKAIKINTESGDIDSDLTDNKEQSTSWGVDLGLLYQPKKLEQLSIGLVGKNLNTPRFKTVGSDDVKVKPQGRLGLAYALIPDKLTAALDADLTKNETSIPGYYAQYVGAGVCYRPASWFALRAGAMQNIEEGGEGTVLTAGLGLGPQWMQFNLAALITTKQGQYNGSSYPTYAKVQLGVSATW